MGSRKRRAETGVVVIGYARSRLLRIFGRCRSLKPYSSIWSCSAIVTAEYGVFIARIRHGLHNDTSIFRGIGLVEKMVIFGLCPCQHENQIL